MHGIQLGIADQAQAAQGAPGAWHSWLYSSLIRLDEANLTRHLRPLTPSGSAVEITVRQRDLASWDAHANQPVSDATEGQAGSLKLFSVNDYLGLSTHPKVCQAIALAATTAGNGPRSSPLVAGFTTMHRQLEEALAELKGTEECLLFPTGFAANLATLSTLGAAPDTAIFSDALNHASIIDGCRLAMRGGAHLHVYEHCNLGHLEQLLQESDCSRKLVVTDSLFSMDGDFADLPALVELKRKYGFLLAIDEAHATLVCGPRGGGAAEAAGVSECVDVHLGTLSKAAGCHGGFVACSAAMRSLLLNRGRAIIYSTALPVPTAAGALAAIRVACVEETWRRRHVDELAQLLGRLLGVPVRSPIVPIVVGSEAHALAASAALLRKGFHVPAIRPPTVPAGTSRLRISLSAAHTTEDVETLAHAIVTTLSEVRQQQSPRARL